MIHRHWALGQRVDVESLVSIKHWTVARTIGSGSMVRLTQTRADGLAVTWPCPRRQPHAAQEFNVGVKTGLFAVIKPTSPPMLGRPC
jgi:hypothetical protein